MFLMCEELVRCEELVPNFHKCEESVPDPHTSSELVPNPHICEELVSNLTRVKNWHQILIHVKKLVPNYHTYKVLNRHRCQ